MKSLLKHMKTYHSYHTKAVTEKAHFIGVPLMLFAILLFFRWVHLAIPTFFDLPFSWILSGILLLYYIKLSSKLALAFAPILLLFNILASLFFAPYPTGRGFLVFLILFVTGLAFLLIGHLFEKKKPAFLDDFFLTLIAPLALTAKVLFHFGFLKELKAEFDAILAEEDEENKP